MLIDKKVTKKIAFLARIRAYRKRGRRFFKRPIEYIEMDGGFKKNRRKKCRSFKKCK